MAAKPSSFVREFKANSGWRVILAAGIGHGLGLSSLPFHTLGSFVGALEASFGWTRAEVQGSIGFIALATVIAGWSVGWLTDRYGVRRVAAVSQVGLALGIALLATARGNLSYWYGLWILMSFAGLGTTPITWTRAVAGWFKGGRGFALSLALSGSGLSTLIGPAAVTLLIYAIGWRTTYLVLSSIVLLVALPSTLFILPRQSSRPLIDGREEEPHHLAGFSLSETVHSYRFWLIMMGAMAIGFGTAGLIPNLVPMLVGRGIAAPIASIFAGILGASIIVGRLVSGYVLDRVWAPAVVCLFSPWPALACLILAQGTTNLLLIGISAVFFGLETGIEIDLVPFLCARYFGMRNYAKVYALQWTSFTIASGLAPAAFGYTYDVTGTYVWVLYVACGLFVAAPLMMLGLGRYPDLERPTPARLPVDAAAAS